jgi:hypothetical protein
MTRTRRADRKYDFRIVDGVLYRTVELPDGTLESFADAARFIDEHGFEGITTTRLWDELEDVPCTQATVALPEGAGTHRCRRTPGLSHVELLFRTRAVRVARAGLRIRSPIAPRRGPTTPHVRDCGAFFRWSGSTCQAGVILPRGPT